MNLFATFFVLQKRQVSPSKNRVENKRFQGRIQNNINRLIQRHPNLED